jgi:hypothetical protein
MSYPNIIVSGAGNSDVDGTYVYTDMYNDHPRYYHETNDYKIFNVFSFYDKWIITNLSELIQYSQWLDPYDYATPDLVQNWDNATGDRPIPTVTAEATMPYTEVARFTVQLDKVVSDTVQLDKVVDKSVEIAKAVSMTVYAELEDNS